jgi:DNA-binding MarR family transcriptional regulator
MSEMRDEIFAELMEQIDESYDLMSDYDAIPHNYGGDEYLYQSESQIIHVVGEHPGITARELSDLIRKTPSFCSQNIKKLRAKGYKVPHLWMHPGKTGAAPLTLRHHFEGFP